MRTVFASRHGSVNESIEMIEHVVQRERLSPAQFSHTVHNAQAGLFCIAAQNRPASCSLAAREDTFACGYLEVLSHLEREPERPVLLVMADVQLAPRFAALVDEPESSYAVAMLIAREGDGTRAALRPRGQRAHAGHALAPRGRLPALAALRRERLSLGRFHWTRADWRITASA